MQVALVISFVLALVGCGSAVYLWMRNKEKDALIQIARTAESKAYAAEARANVSMVEAVEKTKAMKKLWAKDMDQCWGRAMCVAAGVCDTTIEMNKSHGKALRAMQSNRREHFPDRENWTVPG